MKEQYTYAIINKQKIRENQLNPHCPRAMLSKTKATQTELLFINAARHNEAPLINHYTRQPH